MNRPATSITDEPAAAVAGATPAPSAAFTFRIEIVRVARWLAGVIAVLAIVSLAEQYVIHILGRADLEEYLIAVDVDAEANIPTWYSAAALFACSVLLAAITARVNRERGPFVDHWAWLSAIFGFLSIDELAQLHEHLGHLHEMWHTSGVFYFAWVIPAMVFVAAVGLAYAKFLAHLPPVTRRRFIVAAIIYVGGAVGVEALGGWRAETYGMNNMTHSCIATVEEVMEMTGVALFLVALLKVLSREQPALGVRFGPETP
jgi:hypothetical protein